MQGPAFKTTVTGVEMFKKQLDQGQVCVVSLFSSDCVLVRNNKPIRSNRIELFILVFLKLTCRWCNLYSGDASSTT